MTSSICQVPSHTFQTCTGKQIRWVLEVILPTWAPLKTWRSIRYFFVAVPRTASRPGEEARPTGLPIWKLGNVEPP